MPIVSTESVIELYKMLSLYSNNFNNFIKWNCFISKCIANEQLNNTKMKEVGLQFIFLVKSRKIESRKIEN